MIGLLGKGVLLAKVDMKSAFRLAPVYPGDFELLGMYFNEGYYVDKCLPFGCAISCVGFSKFFPHFWNSWLVLSVG
jgi:hypothetical protein